MNPTSRALLTTVLETDALLSGIERTAVLSAVAGQLPPVENIFPKSASKLLVTKKEAADLLSVSRVTIWRMTKGGVFHPLEILPGTLRYRYEEISDFALAHKNCEVEPIKNRLSSGPRLGEKLGPNRLKLPQVA